jgi:DNA processing protein
MKIEHLITLQNIKGVGPVAIKAFINYVAENKLSLRDEKDLYEALNEGCENKCIKIRGNVDLSLPIIQDAWTTANAIKGISLQHDIKVTSVFSKDFPPNLLDTIDEKGKKSVPLILYYKGDLSIAHMPAVAIIGTRNPTPEGIVAGEYYGAQLAKAGYNIVSGLALGCDSAGHRGALSVNGKTTAFLAHGLDSIYPPENKDLAQEIIDKGGLLMSEYPIGTSVNRYNLVARDRLQASLADATLVIQTGIHGGTMHAANTTLMAKKPLWCVEFKNKSSFAPELEGNQYLVDNGAEYVRQDIVAKAKAQIKSAGSTLVDDSSTDDNVKQASFSQGTIPGL